MEKYELPEIDFTKTPIIDPSSFIAKGAVVTGDVRLAQHTSVWYNAVLRGDINYISIGERSNIQDGCILHLENDRPCIVGNDVTVGHGAILHGCTIEDQCLIGMGAIVLNGALIKKGAVVAAGAVVKENMVVKPLELVAGVPAKVIKTLDESTLHHHIKWAEKYCKLAKIHQDKGNWKGQ